ncbi:MAG: CoA transferase [Dehalococcoidia bacterium]|nr:CoA transferase [Dehalococcoidia bacterium]
MKPKQEGALTGYRVLDMADSRGAYYAKLLADFGADVIKIEGPGGDPGRDIPPFAGDEHNSEKSLHFLHRNANKRGVTLNLEATEDKDLLKKLINTADILVENFGPGCMDRHGLSYETLKGLNPLLIMASITEFGQGGPYRDYKGSNLVHFAMSGVLITSGFPGKTPCLIPGSQAYDSASLVAVIGTLTALYMRSTTGEGQYIDTSVHEASRICLYPWILSTYTHMLNEVKEGGVPPQVETRRGDSVYPVYPCKDGYIRIIALTPRQWDAMVRVLGSPEVLLLSEWRNFVYRIFNADALYPLMTEYTKQYSMIELFEAGHREGVPIAPIFTIEDFINSPHTKARGSFVELDHPVAGKAEYPGPPYKWSETPASIRRPSPCLGEHNQEILCDEPHISHDKPAPLQSAGVRCTKGTEMMPLEGVRIIGFETGAVAPDFTKILGELGADVIKVESVDNLDFMRCIGSDINRIGGFNESNRNKRSLGLNLKTEKGKQIARKLIKKCDVLAENFRGGVMKSLGLDYQNVRKLNPDIIYISSQGFGGGGPYSAYQAYGPTIAAASGMLALWSNPDDPYPVGSNSPLPDHMASKHLVVATLAALDYRRRTGKGQFIDMAQTEVAVALLGEYYLDYTYNKRIPKPMGNRCPYAAPHGCYRCMDEDTWCAIAIFTDEEWHSFIEAIGSPDWAHDDRLTYVLGRLDNVDELDRLVEEWTSARGAVEVMETLQAAGVAAGVVQRAPDTLEDPQLKWLGAIIELEHPVAGKTLYPAIPFHLSGTPPLPSRPAPLLSQHTKEICQDVLGISEEEIENLVNEDILHTPESIKGRVKGMLG